MPGTRQYTRADLDAMPDDGQRYELVRGELLVTPSPAYVHQAILFQLFRELCAYLEPHGLVRQVMMAPADITLSPDTLVQPDLFVADIGEVAQTGRWTDVTTLFLVVEVSSPSTARYDRIFKRPEYQRFGIPQYWIADRELQQVEIWTPDATRPVIERQRVTWRHPALASDCVIELGRLFEIG